MIQPASLRARADLPVVSPDEPTALRMRGANGEPVTWTAIDGGEVERVTLGDEEVTAFTASQPGTYRVVGSSASFSAGDTTTITVVSAAVTASIAKLVIRPENASVQPNDTLRYSVWGLTAAGDSVPAAAKLYPSRGYVRGMDYYCPVEGEFTMTAGLEGTSIRVTTGVTVSATASDAPPPPASSVGGTLAKVELTPGRDTIPPNDTLTFGVRGISTTGTIMPVSVKLYADRGYVRGLSYYSPVQGTFGVRAVTLDGKFTAQSYITVKSGAPPAEDYSDGAAGSEDPAPEPTPEPEPIPELEPSPTPSGSVAELPRTYLDTRYIAPTGKTINVPAGGSLQTAINSAERGDQIVLAAGATFVGNYVLPPKAGTGWITIRSSGTLPPEGTRVTPSSASGFAKIATYNSMPALRTTTNAAVSHYRVVGIEFKSTASMTYAIVDLGDYSHTAGSVSDLPHHVILDRVWIHGHSTQTIQRCLTLNLRAAAIIDSRLSDCHLQNGDSQAIVGWSGPGPFKIVNNYIEGGAENVMFGGADPSFTGLIPSDIEFRRNHVARPLSWKSGDLWSVKNLLELKNAQRVLVEANVFENNWADAQTGFAVVLKSQNQSGRCTWCVTRDVTIRYNKFLNSPGGFNLLANQAGQTGAYGQPMTRISITHNVLHAVGLLSQPGTQRIVQALGGLTDIQFEHNTSLGEHHAIMFDGNPDPSPGYIIRNNIFSRGKYGVFGSGRGEGSAALQYYAPNSIFARNVIIGAPASIYPSNNFYPSSALAAGLTGAAVGDYHLAQGSPYVSSSTDGTMAGADVARLEQMIDGVR